MSRPSSTFDRLRETIFANLGLKLFSFVVALGLYAFVHGAGNAQRSIWIDLVTLLPPESNETMLVSAMPERVKVMVSGRSSVLSSLTREPMPPIQVDLRDTSRRTYVFDPSSIEVPAGVAVESIIPSTVELRWERRLERRLSIVPVVVGAPGAGLEVRGEPRVTPESVVVVGPASEVSRASRLTTVPLDISSFRAGTHVRPLALEPLGPNVVARGAQTVSVELVVARQREERLLRRLEIAAVGGSIVGSPRPARADVRVRGLPEVIQTIDADQVLPTVDLTGVDPAAGAVFRALTVRGLPEGVEVMSTTPNEVLVTPARH